MLRLTPLLFFLTLPLAAQSADLEEPRSGLSQLGVKPPHTQLAPDHAQDVFFLRLRDGSGARLVQGQLIGDDPELEVVDLLVASAQGRIERMWMQSDDELARWRSDGEARGGRPLHDLRLFYRVHFDRPGPVAELCDALNALDVVGLAWPIGRVEDPVAPAALVRSRPPRTPDFEPLQLYRGPAPDGVGGDYGNTFNGGQGPGVTIIDVETGWTDDHEDLAHKALGQFVGLPGAPYPWDHGTAVLGILIGEDQGLGVRGLSFDSDVLMSTHQGNSANIPTAIANATAAAAPGDVVVLEVQCYWGPPAPHPCEWDDAIFATVETATALGIHVFAAAGNGDNNLDSGSYGGKFDRSVRDSGAVMVGASDGILLNKASFSNYGSRLDAHGWGWDVVTAGYGSLQSGPPTEEYTDSFSGTSSATPIVTGAGIQIMGVYRAVFGLDMDPLTLRDLLTATGTPQGSGGQIGPRPNVYDALDSLNVPRLEISGNLIPGGNYVVTNRGVAGDPVVLVFGDTVDVHNPITVPPYGDLFLKGVLRRVAIGTLDVNGELVFGDNIPNDGGLSGTTMGYFQNWQRFISGQPGIGAFGNYAPLDIE